MAPKFSYTCSSAFILLFFLSSICICRAHNVSNNEKQTITTSPLDFLKDLNRTRKGDIAKGLGGLKKYLANLGYVNNNIKTNDNRFDDTLEAAIKKYQEFYKLKVTGTLDEETVAALARPRCGVPDHHFGTNIQSGSSFYTYEATVWPPRKRHLTFSLYPALTRADLYVLEDAFNYWTYNSVFTFKHITNVTRADIKIGFFRREHGDKAPFDGPSGILAHASPPTEGRLHFDAEEKWNRDSLSVPAGTFDLLTVAMHEIGHVLGLGHSQDKNAVMYAYVGSGERRVLNNDDIKAIQNLYPK